MIPPTGGEEDPTPNRILRIRKFDVDSDKNNRADLDENGNGLAILSLEALVNGAPGNAENIKWVVSAEGKEPVTYSGNNPTVGLSLDRISRITVTGELEGGPFQKKGTVDPTIETPFTPVEESPRQQ